jgi:hypothetical protein
VSANAGVGRAALISAGGTSVCARRSITFGNPDAVEVWQIGKSATPKAGDMSAAVALVSAMVEKSPASTGSSVTPPSAAAAAEASSFCDRVNVAILSSKIVKRPGSKCSQRGIPFGCRNCPFTQIAG